MQVRLSRQGELITEGSGQGSKATGAGGEPGEPLQGGPEASPKSLPTVVGRQAQGREALA